MGRGGSRLRHAGRPGIAMSWSRQCVAIASAGRGEKMEISRTILDYVMQQSEGVLTSDASEDERWEAAGSIVRMGVREAICVPHARSLRRCRRDLHRHLHPPGSLCAATGQSVHGRTSEADGRHRPSGGIGSRGYVAYYSAMVQAERLAAIGQTIATLSHHIKNILQGIRGGSYLIEEGLKGARIRYRRQGLDHRRKEPGEDIESRDGHADVQQRAATGNGARRHQ